MKTNPRQFRSQPARASDSYALQSSAPPSPQSTPERIETRPLLSETTRADHMAIVSAGLAAMEARTALTPAISAPGVMPGHKEHKESIFVLPVFSRDNVTGIMTLVIKATGYGGFMALVPGAVAALLPPADVKPQYIAAALQGGLAAVAAATVAIPEFQQNTEDKFVIIPNADERWTTHLTDLGAKDPLKIAVLVGMRQKYKLAARQAGGLACTVGAGYFTGGPVKHWGIVSGAMAAGLIGVSFFGVLAQKQIWRDAVRDNAAVLDLSIADPAADVDVSARKAIGEVERLSKETLILPDLGSGISILLAAAGGLVGCLVAARIIGGGKHEDHNAEVDALQKHVKFAVPFIIGGVSQIFMLPAEYKVTAISNIKMRAALAGRAIDPFLALINEIADI